MPRLSVCIETFFGKDVTPQDKIVHCKECGYDAVEFWGWGNKDIAALKATVQSNGMYVSTFGASSERPLVDPNARSALVEGLEKTAKVASELGVDRLIMTTGNQRRGERFDTTRHTVLRNLRALLPVLDKTGLMLVIEPLNPIANHPTYWLTTMPEAADLVYELDHPQVKLLMDIYHQQITEGNVIATIREYIECIGHFHCAGVPGRHELVGGELDYRAIFKAIDETGYDAHVGLEFHPAGDTMEALRQARELTAARDCVAV